MNTTDPHAENKRLYKLDVAAFGRKEAAKRWQILMNQYGGWDHFKSNGEPLWLECNEYRRDPNAPPLPSMDWHEAPSGSKYRVQGSKGPIWYTYVPVYMEVGESRPNKEWFDLTKPENQDPEISESEFWESIGDRDMSDETLTGSALHRAIADVMGKQSDWWRLFKCKATDIYDDEWAVADDAHEFFKWLSEHDLVVRRKPTPHTVTLESGERVEVPKPITETPEAGSDVWLLFDNTRNKGAYEWEDVRPLRGWLAENRLFASREARDQVERALTRILTGGAA